MKACVLHGIGDLRYEEVVTPAAKPGHVLIKIRACGVCGSDIQRVWEKGTYSFPLIPGHEFAGEITGVADDENQHLLGKKAAVFPLLPCGHCDACRIGEYAQCTKYNYFGSRCDGGFAEYISVPVWNLIIIPDALSYEEAAMTEPSAVSLHALRQAGVVVGDNVVVFGAGPIGLMLASWARLWGADKVILVDIDKDKIAFARKAGFEPIIDSREEDVIAAVMALTNGRGADVTVEGTGVSSVLEQCLKCTRMFGKIVAMGNPAREMTLSQHAYWELLRKQLKILGTWNSSYNEIPKNDWEMSIRYMSQGKLNVRPFITHRYSLHDCPDALVMMRDKSELFNKVMIIMD